MLVVKSWWIGVGTDGGGGSCGGGEREKERKREREREKERERERESTYHDASSTLTFARFSLSHSHDTSGPAGAADILAAATAAEPPRSEREPLDRGRQ